jgi:hypothetical protein
LTSSVRDGFALNGCRYRTLRALQFKDFLDHVSLLRSSMLSSVTALKRASPSGVIGWLVQAHTTHSVSPFSLPINGVQNFSNFPRLA